MKINLVVSGFIIIFLPALLMAENSPDSEPVATGSVTAEWAWIKSGKPDAIMLSGYVTLKSNASNRWTLRAVSARYFRTAMIHRTVIQAGVPRMVLQSSLRVRPGETVKMDNQGYHLMFVGPTRKFKTGDTVKVVLQFENQAPIKVNFPVLKRAPKK